MRALGFDVKKPDVLKILKDYDREATGKITFEDFQEVSEYTLSSSIVCCLLLDVKGRFELASFLENLARQFLSSATSIFGRMVIDLLRLFRFISINNRNDNFITAF